MKLVPKLQSAWTKMPMFLNEEGQQQWRDEHPADGGTLPEVTVTGKKPLTETEQRWKGNKTDDEYRQWKQKATSEPNFTEATKTSLNEMGDSWNNFWNYQTKVPYQQATTTGITNQVGADRKPVMKTVTPSSATQEAVMTAAAPALAYGAVTAPVATAASIAGGTLGEHYGNKGGRYLAQQMGLNQNTQDMFGSVAGFGGATLGGSFGYKVGKDVSEGLDYLGVTLPEYLRGYKYGIDVYHGTPTNTFSPKDLKTNDILGLHFGDSETPALYFANVDRGGRIIKGRYLAKESPIFMDADLDSYYTLDWFYDNDPNFVKFLKSKGMAQEELDHLGWAPKIKMGTPEERQYYLADLYKKYGLDFFYRNSAESGGINAGIERSLITMRPERFKPTHLLQFDDPKGMDWSKQKLLSFSEKTPEEQTAILKQLRGDKKYKRIGYSWF